MSQYASQDQDGWESATSRIPSSAPSTIELSPAQAAALIRLLGDDDEKIRRVAREHLGASLSLTRPLLEEARRTSPETRIRWEAEALLVDTARVDHVERWNRFVAAAGPLDLETGTFLIASIEYPQLDVAGFHERLDQIATVLVNRVGARRDPDELVEKLNHLLFRDLGFRGNREAYYDPRNSYLPDVMERRLGIPISLSVLCMLVARRAGCELSGIGMPGHFLVGYRAGRREKYIDPFHGGRAWSLEDCLEHVRAQGHPLGDGPGDDPLRPLATRQILTRMLANLVHIYRSQEDDARTARIDTMLAALNPPR